MAGAMPNRSTQQLLDDAIAQLILDARAAARKRKTTLKAVSKTIFGDTRTLPSIIKGRRKVSIERVGNAASTLEEMKQ